MNGKAIGLYLLVEGIDEGFLRTHFGSADGNLYEGADQDINAPLEIDSSPRGIDRSDLQALIEACEIAPTRWGKLSQMLDIDRFATFMAMELLVAHKDGYCMDLNNYRLYHDAKTGKFVFIAHGMDFILDNPVLKQDRAWKGMVARAFIETPEGRRIFKQRVAELGSTFYAREQGKTSLRGIIKDHARVQGARDNSRTNVPGASAHTPFACSLQKRRESIRPTRVGVRALDFFCEDLLEDVLVQRQVGDQLLQTVILFFKLLEPPQFADAHSTILLLPVVEGCVADAHLPADFRRLFSCFHALERVDNLLIAMPLLLHGSVLSFGPHQSIPPTPACPVFGKQVSFLNDF